MINEIVTVEWVDGAVRVLDQSRLPWVVEHIDCRDYRKVAEVIKEMRIRGAPLIGVVGAFGMVLAGLSSGAREFVKFREDLIVAADLLVGTRPTGVNLKWGIERIIKLAEDNRLEPVEKIKQRLLKEALAMVEEDREVNRKIGENGAGLVSAKANILTHCNAGALATAGYGTALGVIRAAFAEGKEIKVFVDETRPKLQGARLTVWELMQVGIPCVLICDNMAGYLMKKGLIDLVIVGADRIAGNGDVVNKIGTYTVAVLARRHEIPFYVAAPWSTVDLSLSSGDEIPIEERALEEVLQVGGVRVAPENVAVLNPAFDVTPAELVTAIITERGVVRGPFERGLRQLSGMVKHGQK